MFMNKTKKILAMIFVVVLSISMISTTNVSAAKKVKLNKTKATIYVGKTITLKLKNNKKKVKWTTSNKKIATVNKKGKVKGKKAGKVTITAKVGKKKYKCKVTVKKQEVKNEINTVKKNTTYGSISGNITYYYNRYQGNKADTGAYVILVPTDGTASNANLNLYSSSYELEKNHIYIVRADGIGNYKINHVPTGTYKVLMFSSKTSTGDWFNVYDDTLSDAPDSYYDSIAQYFYPQYLNMNTAMAFAKSVSYHKYYRTQITIYENEETYLSHDFGITYI